MADFNMMGILPNLFLGLKILFKMNKNAINTDSDKIIETQAQGYEQVTLWFEDESRVGLFTKDGRMLTAKGVKPVCTRHQVFLSTWLLAHFLPLPAMLSFGKCFNAMGIISNYSSMKWQKNFRMNSYYRTR